MDEKDKLIQEMTEALEEAIQVQERFSETLEKLEEENNLLNEVILKHHLDYEVEKKRRQKKAAQKEEPDEDDSDLLEIMEEERSDKTGEMTLKERVAHIREKYDM